MNTRFKTDMELVQDALDAFTRDTNIMVQQVRQEQGTSDNGIEARVRLVAKGHTMEFLIQSKATVSGATIGQIKHQFENHPGRCLLVTRYVPTTLARKMKDLRIQFIDTAGNAYIEDPRLLIYMTGHRPLQPVRAMREESMLGRAGLYVVFALLCNEGLEKQTYRDVAKVAKVALGTVAGVWRDLRGKGYLIEVSDDVRRLVRKKELIAKWTTGYAERLRPKNLLGRYTPNHPDFWQEANLLPYDAQWGGEVAANKMTRYLKPEVVTIYTNGRVNELVLGLKLRKNDTGNVELRQRFWRFDHAQPDKDLVPPLLIYADLLATADARNVETAKMIYDEYLERHIREN